MPKTIECETIDGIDVYPCSKPQALVKHIAWCVQQIPEHHGIQLGGENALARLDEKKWNNIKAACDPKNYGNLFEINHKKSAKPYASINILRIGEAEKMQISLLVF